MATIKEIALTTRNCFKQSTARMVKQKVLIIHQPLIIGFFIAGKPKPARYGQRFVTALERTGLFSNMTFQEKVVKLSDESLATYVSIAANCTTDKGNMIVHISADPIGMLTIRFEEDE